MLWGSRSSPAGIVRENRDRGKPNPRGFAPKATTGKLKGGNCGML